VQTAPGSTCRSARRSPELALPREPRPDLVERFRRYTISFPVQTKREKLRDALVPSSGLADRLTRLETQVAYLAERLDLSSEELEVHAAPTMPEEVLRLLADDRKLEAAKVYRQATGASAATAMRIVGAEAKRGG